jgi:thiol-disulfide isomerase/thioredoxin
MKRSWQRLTAVFAVAGLSFALPACGHDDLRDQYLEGSNKGYIGADGFETVEIAPEDRGDPVKFEGALDNGELASSADYEGQVLVVNFWYATCGPCIVEAPFLEAAHETLAGDEVSFLGVNIYDQPPTAQSFARDNDVTYPSLIGANDPKILLAFAQHTTMRAVPTTLVLDTEGRVAARLIGSLTETSVLETIVRDTVDARS